MTRRVTKGWARKFDEPIPLPRVNLNGHPYAREGADGQAVVCPLLRGRSPTRGVAPKQHWGLRRTLSPAFRAGGMVLLIPWRVGAEGIWRGVILVYWFRRRDAARPARAAWAVQAARWKGRRRRRRRFRFIDFRAPALT